MSPEVPATLPPRRPSPRTEPALRALARLRQPVWVLEVATGLPCWANAAALALWDAPSANELAARLLESGAAAQEAQRLRRLCADFACAPDATFEELVHLPTGADPRPLRVAYSALQLDDDRMLVMAEGLDTGPLGADLLRAAETVQQTPVLITLYTDAGEVVYRNPAARATLGTGTEPLDQHLLSAADLAELRWGLSEAGAASLVACVRTVDGPRWHDVSARRFHDADTGRDLWLVSEVDVSQLKAAEKRARFLATHDHLTRLPNRNFLAEQFAAQLRTIRSRQERGAVVLIDLDNFKHVNDSLGHAAGDRLLVKTARRLRSVLGRNELLARLGGDEFLLLVSAADIVAHVQSLAERITGAVAAPMHIAGREIRVTPTLGVSLYPDHGRELETLMSHADLAVYQAKSRGRNGLAFFTPELSAAVRQRMTLERDIRRGLDRGEFTVYFQPRVQLRDGTICGAEALARWQHPEHGIVGPDGFVFACEEMGLIGELGLQVFEQAVRQHTEWRTSGFDLELSVNLSSVQIADPELVPSLLDIVRKHRADPRHLELEITESALLGHDEETVATIAALRSAGFRIAIDDFGTGYSNLAYLQRYPLDCLKIDRSFVSTFDVPTPLTELIVDMAKLLRMKIIAEGVETEAQLDWLREQGCQEYQGELFSPPIPREAMTRLLAAQRDGLGTAIDSAPRSA